MMETHPEQPIVSETNRTEKDALNPSIYLQTKTSEEIDIDAPESYQFIKTIGDGSFGKVKLGRHRLTGEKVAIKILCKERIKEKTDIERISRQIKIMKHIRHPFVVQMYQIIQSPKYLFLIMEYIEGGDLFDAITSNSKLPEEVAKVYFSQIVLGLEYLHNAGITHRDMKPENILIGEYGKIKIADFGLGNFFNEGEKLRTACGSPCYAPPEMLNQQEYNPRKVDIWSSGIILYAMVHGYLPFEDQIQSVLYQKIKTKNVRIASSVSIPCRNLIRGLLVKDPGERWDIATIRQHEFLQDVISAEQQYVNLQTADTSLDEFKQICNHLGILEEDHNRLFSSIKKNKHNNLTTLFYLGKKQLLRKIVEEGNVEKEENIEITEKEEKIEQFAEIDTLEKRPFTFFQNEKPTKQEIIESKIERSNDDSKEKEQMHKKDSIQHSNHTVQSFQPETPPESPNQPPEPRKPPTEFAMSPEQLLSKVEVEKPKSQSKHENLSSIVKPQPQSRPPIQSFTSKNPKKQPEPVKKVQQKQKPSRLTAKGQLKKSQRMIMYKPQEQSKLAQSEVKLYQRSHSKDRPIVLKNTLKMQKNNIKQKRQEQVTSKAIHIQPHIVDAQKLVLCSFQKLSQTLSKKGYTGRFQFYSYGKECILVTKSQLRSTKSGNKYQNNQLQKIIGEINQSIGM